MNPNQPNEWQYLAREIWCRSWQPFKSVPFVCYFIVAIIIFAGLGIWVEVYKCLFRQAADNSGLFTALSTFIAALIGSASLKQVFIATDDSDKVLASFSLLVCFLSLFAVILTIVFYPDYPSKSLGTAVGLGFIAVWFWWITNGRESTYHNARIDAATGGSTDGAVKGNLSEFKVD